MTSNRWIGIGLAVELAVSVVLVYLPGLNQLFSMAALPPQWLLVLPAGAALFVLTDQARRLLGAALPPSEAYDGTSISPGNTP